MSRINDNAADRSGVEATEMTAAMVSNPHSSSSSYSLRALENVQAAVEPITTADISCAPERLFFCSICFISHPLGRHINIEPLLPVRKPFKCHLCEASFNRRKQCLDHLQTQHHQEFAQLQHLIEKSDATPNNEDERDPDTNDNTNKSGVICAFCMRHLNNCDRSFSSENLIKQHMKQFHAPLSRGLNEWKCEYCGSLFTRKGNRNQHIKQHHDPMSRPLNGWKCEYCDKSFTTQHYMKQHMRRWHDPV